MTKEWAIHRQAAQEIDEAVAWYEEQREGLGAEFLAEARRVLAKLRALPTHAAPVWPPRGDLRLTRVQLQRFPYALIVLELDDQYRVLAVAHGRREAGYWGDRAK